MSAQADRKPRNPPLESWPTRQFMAAALAFVMSLAYIAGTWSHMLAVLFGNTSPGTPSQLAHQNVWDLVGVTILVGLVPLLTLGIPGPVRRAVGAGLPGPYPLVRFICITSAAMAVMPLADMVTSLFGSSSDGQEQAVKDAWLSNPAPTLFAASAHAGITEEVFALLAPTIVTFVAIAVVTHIRTIRRDDFEVTVDHTITQVAASPRTWWICIATCTIGLIDRYTGHLYQGTPNAVGALGWGAAFLILYAIGRSIWPLMLGHFLHDLIPVSILDTATAGWIYLSIVVVVLGASTIWLLTARRLRSARGVTHYDDAH